MSRISAFSGIVITILPQAPAAAFHANHGQHVAEIAIDAHELIDGWLPPRALRLVLECVGEHQAGLRTDWDRASAHEQLIGSRVSRATGVEHVRVEIESVRPDDRTQL